MSAGEIEDREDGHLIKVLAVVDGGRGFLGKTSSGSTVRFSLGGRSGLKAGQIVFISDHQWEVMPGAVWPEISELAIVRRLLDDGLVLEVGASMRFFPGETSVDVEVGNTVEFNDADGVTRVISETPLRYRDFGVDEEGVQDFLVERSASGETLNFSSFGGYQEVRERAVELIETQFRRRENLDEIGARPVKGVIFTGPPGTGKTHLARIIANESDATFFLVSGPSIVSKWVGDSEGTLRRIFEAAKKRR